VGMAVIDDLKQLLAVSTRETSIQLLQAELAKRRAVATLPKAPLPASPIHVEKAVAQTVFMTVTRYAWDQNKKWVKVYVTLPGLDALPKDAVTFHIEPRALRLEVVGLPPPASNSRLLISPLFGEVVTDQCSCTRKPDSMLLLKLRKAGEVEEEWGSIDDSAHRKAREKEGRLSENKSKSTADLLQEMYRDADEEG